MTSQTLSQRLSEGRIPVSDALRYSMILADTLRKLHEDGRAHGAVSPDTLQLTATGLELLPPPALDRAASYMAPEVLEGRPADSRSDIFSFGTIVYEMLSGRRAFEGAERGPMPSSGSPAIDRLVGGCVAKEPSARIQRIQKVMLELKLLAVSASRAAAAATPRRDPNAEAIAALRLELQQMEARFNARIDAVMNRVQNLEQAEPVVVPDTTPLHQAIEGIQQQVGQLHQMVGEDFMNFEKTLQAHAGAIDSTRTAMAQTDDLVERVVEALESLQTTVLENAQAAQAV